MHALVPDDEQVRVVPLGEADEHLARVSFAHRRRACDAAVNTTSVAPKRSASGPGSARGGGADLLVVGSKGMQRRVPGSVPNTVTHRADCSVLVVKTV